jgi:uncharacterized membrane protein
MLPLISVALMLVASAAAYAFLPETMAVHWSLTLQPDGYAKKALAVLIMPAIGLVLIAIQLAGRAVSSPEAVPVRFSKAVTVALPVFALVHLVILATGLMAVRM